MSPDTDQKERIFRRLCDLLREFSPPLVLGPDTSGQFHLIGNTPAPYGASGKMIPGMYFASVMMMKGHVGFYFFAQYTDGNQLAEHMPHMIKTLKGKSCFHLKKESDIVESELRSALDKGIELYRTKGFIV